MPMKVPEHEGWVEADLDLLPHDGNRYELIDGSLHVCRRVVAKVYKDFPLP